MKNKKNKKKQKKLIEKSVLTIVKKVGSVPSIIIHSFIFISFVILGITSIGWNRALLILTTILSIEAIYLAIFIQMTVNSHTQSLAEVEENIDEIQEDIDEIQEDEEEAEKYEKIQAITLENIQDDIKELTALVNKLIIK